MMGKGACIGILITVVISLLVTQYFNNPTTLSSLADLMASRSTQHGENTNKVVIVVGGGLAGLSAALEAQKLGARVYVVEKESRLGGNSAKASSGMNAVGTPAQHAAHSQDTPASFIEDTLVSGGGACVHELVDTIVARSAEAVAFLTDRGVDLSVLSKCGGHHHARTHRAKPPPAGQPARNIGFEITSKLIDLLNKTENITILTDSRVKQLIQEKGAVVGVKYEDKYQSLHELRGDAVILASGGYAADRSPGGLLEKYGDARLAGLPTTNGPWATGDGVRLAEGVGAKFVLMNQIQIHPTGFVDPKDPLNPTKFLAPEALRAVGGIIINKEGKRFVDELSLRNQVTTSIFEHGFRIGEGDKHLIGAYLVLNDEAVNTFGPAALKFYMSKGFIVQYPNADEFATTVGVDKESLHQTIASYNQAKEKGTDEFGKTTFPVAFDVEKPLSVLIITPSIHYTMGGALITTSAQVVGSNGSIVPGLYAAGEASGGVHGNNRLAGNSLLECVVFGRIAGTNAARNV